MAGTVKECEQYVFKALGRVGRARHSEPLIIFESPLGRKQGTLFMIQTPEGEERGVFQSAKYGGEAMRDMRNRMRDIHFTRVDQDPLSERAGVRLTLAE